MKQCRECGTLSPDDTVFCYICGTKFPELPETVKKAQLADARKRLFLVLMAIIAKKK